MSDTSKATPACYRWKIVPSSKGDLFWFGTHWPSGVVGYTAIKSAGGFHETALEAKDAAELIVEAVNAYNSERDRLTRELAEMVIEGAGCNLSDCACGGSLPDYARRLLKLYEEEKP